MREDLNRNPQYPLTRLCMNRSPANVAAADRLP